MPFDYIYSKLVTLHTLAFASDNTEQKNIYFINPMRFIFFDKV